MRKKYLDTSTEDLLRIRESLQEKYEAYKAEGLDLNMSRGKPNAEQLHLSMGMMDVFHLESDLKAEDGTDCRNYGNLEGIPEAKRLLASIAEVEPENIILFGNSSLNTMFDMVSMAFCHGVLGNEPWCRQGEIKFLCPVPGYDRHFRITELFGFKMINIPMDQDGPDMDMVEQYVNNDPTVKGIWCVPKYSNPQGYSYSDETVRRFAALNPAAPDFRIFWDNAYSVHHLYYARYDVILEILAECRKAGHPDMVYKFTSTSKISFPGAGIAAIASSKANLDEIREYTGVQTIGHNKINQLRHVRYFRDIYGIQAQMRRHADIIRPKFELVESVLDDDLGGLGIGTWTNPRGGYFISFDSMEGCAKAIVARAQEAGLTLTPAGATYPYGYDPMDSNIRIAPTYPSMEELYIAIDLFTVCVRLVSIEKILEERFEAYHLG
ncbi:MAG: aminotransferase class I/II-fold pyridoxal phosphate-dependent enzyme [Lachnospiraceae bacterium]|nr:aminotransferase class I/II-fold pyridoxal phosphate-dependent enzyme [Lachnospiraceae bacterium]